MNNGRDNDPDRTLSDIYRTQTDIYRDTQTDIYRGYDTDYNISRQPDEYIDAVQPDGVHEKQKVPVKRKKRRKKHYFLRFLLTAAVIAAAYAFITSSVFSIDSIVIEGNTLMSDDEIIELSGVSKGDNMFKQTERRVKKALTVNHYIADVSVSRDMPNIYKISIVERIPVIAVPYSGMYVILDEEGVVVDEADSTMHATLVTGITVSSCETGKQPVFDDSANFRQVSSLIKAVNESGMFFKKVELENSLSVKGYVTDTLICSGQSGDIIAQLEQIKAVLYDLDSKSIKRGIIRVGSDGYISFSPITE